MPQPMQKARAEGDQETCIWVLADMWGPDDSSTGYDAGAEEGGAGGRPRGDGYGQAGCQDGIPPLDSFRATGKPPVQ